MSFGLRTSGQAARSAVKAASRASKSQQYPKMAQVASSSSSAAGKSSTSKARIHPCEPALTPPSFYRTQPPPHHPHSERYKASVYHSPWKSARGPNDEAGGGGLFDFLKTRVFDWDESPLRPGEEVPKATPCTWKPAGDVDSTGKVICTWVGHASCHFQIPVPGTTSDRISVLTDPVLSHRCSPVQFMGPARLQRPPTSVTDMASSNEPHVWPDVLVISHNHYDHLDYNTVKAIVSRPNGRPVPHVFCPLGLTPWFRSLGVAQDGITELDWWDQRILELDGASGPHKLKMTCVPAQHFSGRSASDRNQTLWAGWVMEAMGDAQDTASGHKIYFAGDTAYRRVSREQVKAGKDHDLTEGVEACPAFAEIGELLGPFDLAMIPIGAYKPRAFMSMVHADPWEAVHIHKDVRSKQSVAIHWGVFPLAADGPNEPPQLLQKARDELGVSDKDFTCMAIGETRLF